MKSIKLIALLCTILLLNSGEIKAQLSGEYTIGSTGNFQSLNDAVDALNLQGVSTSVTFKLQAGFFNEQVTIAPFAGASEQNRVFFESESNDPSSTVLTYSATSQEDNFIIRLDGCQFVTIRDLRFETNSSDYCTQIHATNGVSHISIEKSHFNANNVSTGVSDDLALVIFDQYGPSGNNNKVVNNTFTGGAKGLVIRGQQGVVKDDIQIIENKFEQQTEKAVEVTHVKNSSFNNNEILYSGVNSAAWFIDIEGRMDVVSNRVYSSGSGGIKVIRHDWEVIVDTLFIVNNMISTPNGKTVHLEEVKTVMFIHNSLFSESSVYHTIYMDKVDDVKAVNNLAVMNGAGGVFQLTNSGSNIQSFNNGFVSMGTLGLRDSGPIYSLSEWQQSVNAPGVNSVFKFNFNFRNNNTDLTPYCGMPIELKTSNYIARFGLDINGDQRNPVSCWRGAVEMKLPLNHKTSINGLVYDGTDTLKYGHVLLFADTTNGKKLLDTVAITTINQADGSYNFNNVRYASSYWLKTIPDSENAPNYLAAYHSSELRWDDEVSFKLQDSCVAEVFDIKPRKIKPYVAGNYTISGNVSTSDPGGQVEGTDPIPGLDVVLDKIPPARNTIAITQTDINGNYSFSNLPDGTYQITIDYAGLPADTIYEVVLDSSSSTITNLDYCVDTTAQIDGCAPVTVSSNRIAIDNQIAIYPNPINEHFVINGVEGIYNYYVMSVDGKLVTARQNVQGQQIVNTEDLSSGTYFVKVVYNNEKVQEIRKLVK